MGIWNTYGLSIEASCLGTLVRLSTASAGHITDDYIGSPCKGPYGDLEPLVLGTPGEAGGPAVGGLVRIVWFFGQFRLLVGPEGRSWLMLRLGLLDSGVWLFAGICYLYQARLRRKPSWLPVALIQYEVMKYEVKIWPTITSLLFLIEVKAFLFWFLRFYFSKNVEQSPRPVFNQLRN